MRKFFGRAREIAAYLGPAFIVSVAYIDPGNFATNIGGGSRYGYTLLWVILVSNAMAIFLQIMSAKVGIATGKNIPELCAEVFPKPVNWAFWIIAELGAMATDLAEFLGGTLGLNLLFGIPMLPAGLLTGALTYLICCTERYGQRIVERIITVLVAVVGFAYLTELFLAKPDWAQTALGCVTPALPDRGAAVLAVGMLGATVMPHVIYLHSALVQCRCGSDEASKRKCLRMEKLDVAFAMNVAFFVNAAMVVVSAAVFYRNGMVVDTMQEANRSLEPLLGPLSGAAFGLALLAAGLSSSAVGTMAGQTIMKGFVNLSIPVNLRRLITMAPALLVIALGMNMMDVLVISQVALSFILPFPVMQMLAVAKRRGLMGRFANTLPVRLLGVICAAAVVVFNAALLIFTFSPAF